MDKELHFVACSLPIAFGGEGHCIAWNKCQCNMEDQCMSVTCGKKEILVEALEVLAFVVNWYTGYFLECCKYTYQQTNQQAVSVYIYFCSSIYF